MKASLLLRRLVTKQRRHLSWFKPRKTVHSASGIHVPGT